MGGVGVALAIMVGLLSSFIQSLGLTIQRKSHLLDSALPPPSQRTPARRPLWLFGFTIYITSNIFSTIFQLDTLPIVILAPLGAVSLIYNALLARLLLGDRFSARTIAGTLLVAGGASLIAIFGVVQEEEHGIEELLVLWARPAFLGFFGTVMGLTGVVLVVSHVVAYITYRSLNAIRLDETYTPISATPSNYASPHDPPAIPFIHRRWSAPLEEGAETETETSALLPLESASSETPRHKVHFAPSVMSDTLAPSASIPTLVPTPTPAQQRTITLLGLAFASASGILSGMSLVLAKAAVELLVMTLDHYRTGKGANQFKHPQSWFLVGGLAVGGLAQLIYLNYSLTFASPALICPLAFCCFNLSSIFDGLVFYDQFSLLSPLQISLVSVGVALLLVGVWVVSAVKPTGEGGVEVGTWVEEEDEEDDDDGKLPDQFTHGQLFDSPALSSDADSPLDETPPTLAERRSTAPPAPLGSATGAGISTGPGHGPSRWYLPSPLSPSSSVSAGIAGVSSPTSPSHRRRRRYGSLIPVPLPLPGIRPRHGQDEVPGLQMQGFSIGLGAASPGFALRAEPDHGHVHVDGEGTGHAETRGRRGRSRSEGHAGVVGTWSGVVDGPAGVEVEGVDGSRVANAEERDIAEARGSGRSRWPPAPWRFWRREGKIRLEGESERET